MHDATGSVATPEYRIVQGIHRETRLHPIADRVPHDTAVKHVLDRAEIEPALVGPVLGDVDGPQFVDVISGEVAPDQVVVDRRAGPFPVLAPLLSEDGPPLVVTADPSRNNADRTTSKASRASSSVPPSTQSGAHGQHKSPRRPAWPSPPRRACFSVRLVGDRCHHPGLPVVNVVAVREPPPGIVGIELNAQCCAGHND